MKKLINLSVVGLLFISQLGYAAGDVQLIANQSEELAPTIWQQTEIMTGLNLVNPEMGEVKISDNGDSVVFDAGETLVINSPDNVVMMIGNNVIQYEQDIIKVWSRPYNVEALRESLIQDLDTSSLGNPNNEIESPGVLNIIKNRNIESDLAEYSISQDLSLAPPVYLTVFLGGGSMVIAQALKGVYGLATINGAMAITAGGMACVLGLAAATGFFSGVFLTAVGCHIYDTITN